MAVSLCMLASPLHAWMWEVDDQRLSEVTGEGFSSFTLENNIARAYFDITASTFTEIDSLKMGYYEAVPGDPTSIGWDQDWTSVSLGSSSEDLVCRGLYVEAGFSNITDPASRSLNYLKVGTPSMTGPITANFNSLTGTIKDSLGTVTVYNRTNLGLKTIYSNNADFHVQIDKANGWRVHWENATVSP